MLGRRGKERRTGDLGQRDGLIDDPARGPPAKAPKPTEKRSQSQSKIEKILAMDTKEVAEADLEAMLPRPKRQRSVAPRRAGRSGGARSVAVVA